MHVAEVIGYVAAVLVFMTFYMKTRIPLRIVGTRSNCAFRTLQKRGPLNRTRPSQAGLG